jgi:hypothetical protein
MNYLLFFLGTSKPTRRMKNLSFKKILPYVAAIVIFLVITIVYFSPLLEGKQLLQSDIMHHKGAAKEIMDFRAQTGTEPLWTNSMFGGMPAYQISTVYKGNQLGMLDKIMTLGLPHPANIVFLYFLGFFILLLVMKVDPWLAIAGAIGFALSSYFVIIIDAGHNSKAFAIGYMAPVLAGIILTLRKKYLWGGILTAIFLSLEIKMNHPQITYYLLIIVLIFGLFELFDAIRNKWTKSFLLSVAVLSVAAVFAVLTNITSLWTTYEYGKYTIRAKSELTDDLHNKTDGLDKDYVTMWSYGIGETMTLLIPDFYGGSSSAKTSPNSEIVKALEKNNVPKETITNFTSQPLPYFYWGGQPGTSGPVYVGAIIFFLFILGLVIVKGPVKWWLLVITVLSIVLSWGHNLMSVTEFFLTYVPGYNKFRAVTMTLVIAEFAMPLLGILALKEFVDRSQERRTMMRGLQIAAGISGFLALVFAVIPGAFLSFTGPNDANFAQQLPDWFIQAIRDERMRLVRMDAVRSLAFILLTAGGMVAFYFGKLKKEYMYILVTVLILADLFTIDKRYLNNENFTSKSRVTTPFSPSPADELILKDQDPDFRVYNLTVNPFMDASTSFFHKSIGGYHGAKLRRYQELIEKHLSKNNLAVLSMLNAKYIIVPDQDRNPVLQVNPEALGNAWFVTGYRLVDNADQEIAALDQFNPADTAIVDKSFASMLSGYTGGRDSLDAIRLTAYQPNRLDYEYTSAKDGLAVFSEIYYPKGWDAYVDGKLTPHFRVNYVLRAMMLPAGSHKLEFRFEPKAYYTGEKVSLASSILLLLIVAAAGGFEIFRALRKKE